MDGLKTIIGPSICFCNHLCSLFILSRKCELYNNIEVEIYRVFRWIVWSLACLEKRTGLSFFKPASLMDRMKYRYDREEAAGRSVLRRLVEKDVGAGVPMVLVVAEVAATSLLLTDGWYSLPCNIEPGSPLQQLVQKKMIVEGTKLVTQGAELLGGEEGCHPLQAEDRSLKLHVNSTRRVRCNARLGQCPPIAVGLRGPVLKVDAHGAHVRRTKESWEDQKAG